MATLYFASGVFIYFSTVCEGISRQTSLGDDTTEGEIDQWYFLRGFSEYKRGKKVKEGQRRRGQEVHLV